MDRIDFNIVMVKQKDLNIIERSIKSKLIKIKELDKEIKEIESYNTINNKYEQWEVDTLSFGVWLVLDRLKREVENLKSEAQFIKYELDEIKFKILGR